VNQTSTEIVNEAINYFEPSYLMFYVTIILVAVTLFYAIQTRSTVNAIKQSSELTVKPFVKFSIINYFYDHICLQIVNVGSGPAVNVESEYVIKSGNEKTESTWNATLLIPNHKEKFFIEINGKEETHISYFKKNNVIIETKIKYQNIFGKKFEEKEIINVSELVTSDSKQRFLEKGDPLERIADMLYEIKLKMKF
jgi:hypothetical protein